MYKFLFSLITDLVISFIILVMVSIFHCCRYLNAKGYIGGFNKSDLDTIFTNMSKNFTLSVQNFAPVAAGLHNYNAINQFEYSLGRMKPETALSAAKTVFLSDLRNILPQVPVPCTIIQSKEDRIVPVSVAFYMKKKLKVESRVRILKTVGHLPQLTDYTLLLKVLMEFLKYLQKL